MRDQLVFGIQDEKIEQKLIDAKNVIFQTAVGIAELFESVEVGVNSLHKMKDSESNMRYENVEAENREVYIEIKRREISVWETE